jgi:hypothetical protein
MRIAQPARQQWRVSGAAVKRAGRTTALTCVAALLLLGAPAQAAAPQTLCVLDARVDELSGLVATPTGYVALNDGKFGTSALSLHVLDRRCRVTRVITDQGFDPLDPEDLARTPDGTLWVADTGDNDRQRTRIAVNRIPPGASRGVAYRLTYPDRAFDAEAMLVQPDQRVLIVTKAITGVARLFISDRPLTGPAATMPLRLAGEIPLNPTGTDGGPEDLSIASTLVTGAALAPDGRRVTLRTYTDAYEWDVENGDFAAAMTSTAPRRTPLPGEPQGEAITYTSDGREFVTGSEGLGEPLLRWTPMSAAPEPRSAAATATDQPRGSHHGLALAGVAGLGLVLLLAGGVALLRRRR